MSLNDNIKTRITNCVNSCFEKAEISLGRTFDRPLIRFNQRGKVAGSARLNINELRFNPVLLVDNQQEFEKVVVPHEVSHILVYQIHGKVAPHGREWRDIMSKIFGLSAQTRHQMDVSKVQGKTFLYRCACGTVPLTIRRHNKVVNNRQRYICRACGNPLLHESQKP